MDFAAVLVKLNFVLPMGLYVSGDFMTYGRK
jgi:hypothetical protein